MIQIGHLHPLLVHLPIGILLLAFALELYVRRKPSENGNDIVLFTLAAAVTTALLSLGTGWLLGDDGGFDETLLFRHRWMAVAMTVGTIILYFLKRSEKTLPKKAYMPWFMVVLLLLGITGHLGGNMTHGEDFLFKEDDTAEVIIEDVDKAMVYGDIVKPIMDAKCVSCHNTNKTKGGLLMTSKEELLAGGDSGSILDSLFGGTPQLLARVHLPLADEEHMPPKGKVQLTEDEIALMEWWMQHKNCFDCRVGDLERSSKMGKLLASLETDTSPRAVLARNAEPVPADWLEALEQKGISFHHLAEDNPLIIVNLEGRKDLTSDEMELLSQYGENIVELNLAGSNLDDKLADYLSEFDNLTKLQLQRTTVTDKSLDFLESLEYLGSLNLYGTQITDAVFDRIEKLPNLTNLYLWQTEVTEARLKRYAEAHPAIAVQGKIGNGLFAASSLEAPTIVAETALFTDSLEVRLENVFKDADVFYTLDGSEPDSTATRYEKAIKLTTSTEVRAITQKKGWKASLISMASFKKTNVDYENVSLRVPPDGKYKAQLGKTLIDLKRGSTNFVDGNWLGFSGKHAELTMQLSRPQNISTVSIGALSAPTSWIFFPTGLTVWTSSDGKRFKKAGSVNYPPQEPSADVAMKFLDITIPPTDVKFVRIKVDSPLKNPEWHPAPGGESWIFMDEVLLN